MANEKKWLGSPTNTTCDLCSVNVKDVATFYDAKTRQGPWGILCPSCFRRYGLGLGTGLGQQYDSETFIKIGG
jgi:hypothetical protein